MAALRARGLATRHRRPRARPLASSGCRRTMPAAFDGEPLKPYNVGPDALLVNFKSVRFVFAPERGGQTAWTCAPSRRCRRSRSARCRSSARGDCGDWRGALRRHVRRPRRAAPGRRSPAATPASCGERDWYVALLDHPHYVLGMFTTYFREAGGRFDGGVKEGRAPAGATPFATLRVAAALRRRARRQQAVEQRDGAAAVPDARDDRRIRRRRRPAGATETVRQWLARAQAAHARARAGERLGAVAQRARQRRRPRAPAGRGRREPGARGVRELARRGRGGRHRAAALPERQRRRPGAAQDRHARRRRARSPAT